MTHDLPLTISESHPPARNMAETIAEFREIRAAGSVNTPAALAMLSAAPVNERSCWEEQKTQQSFAKRIESAAGDSIL
jgi:hypothetical protein